MSDTSNTFPTTLNSFTTPRSTGYPVTAANWSALVAAVNAIETKIGTGASTPSAGKVLRATGTGTSGWGAVVDADVSASAAITPNKLSLSHFSARRSVNTGGVTGNGTAYTIIFDTADISNASYSTSTGIYTAPATGAYNFEVALALVSGAAAQTNGVVKLITTARTYRWDFDPYTTRNSASGASTISFAKICDMTLNDTAKVELTISGGPTDSAIVLGNTYTSCFSGFRIA